MSPLPNPVMQTIQFLYEKDGIVVNYTINPRKSDMVVYRTISKNGRNMTQNNHIFNIQLDGEIKNLRQYTQTDVRDVFEEYSGK